MVHTTPSPQDCSWVSILHLTLYTLYWFIVLTFVSVLFSAKARLSKKVKLNKPTDDNLVTEPETLPETFEPNADTILDDPVPQVQDTYVEPVEINPTSQSADPPSPSADPPSPAKTTAKPPSPAKTIDDTTDDVMITGFGHTAPGKPVALSKHSAKEEFSGMDKGKWKTDLSSYAHLSA